MAPTPLDPTTRFIPQGTSRYYWLPAIADAGLAASRTEIDAGTDLTCEVAAVTGWSTTAAQVDTPDACSRFISRVPGSITPDDSSFTFYGSKTGDDARAFFTRDQAGFVMFLDGGDVPTEKAEVFPVTVTNVSTVREITGAFQVVVAFSITADPQLVAIPAAV